MTELHLEILNHKRKETFTQLKAWAKEGVKDNIKITFLSYPFLPLHPKIQTGFLPLFHLKDLASDKAATIGRRGAWRDYVDLFFLLKNKTVDLENLIKETQRRFGIDFSPKLFLEQLIYYDDIKDFTIDFISKKYAPEEIKRFFEKEIRQYTKTKLEA